jgi:hypothetical protein
VPAGARGRWCEVSAEGLAALTRKGALAQVTFLDAAGGRTGGLLHLRRGTGRGTSFIPAGARSARLEVFGGRRPPEPPRSPSGRSGRRARRRGCSPRIRIWRRGWRGRSAPPCCAPNSPRRGCATRSRGRSPRKNPWRITAFGSRCSALGRLATCPPSSGALRWASSSSTTAGTRIIRRRALPWRGCAGSTGPRSPTRSWGSGAGGLPGGPGFAAALRLRWNPSSGRGAAAPRSLLARGQLAALGLPAVAYADEDERAVDGGPTASPLFKPEPNRALMVSGTLSRGLWLVRRDCWPTWGTTRRMRATAGPKRCGWASGCGSMKQGKRGRAARAASPFVLTHRRADAAAAPPEALARVVGAHLRRAGLPFEAEAAWPLRVWPRPLPRPGRSRWSCRPPALRGAERCIKAVLAGTRHADFDWSSPCPSRPARRGAAGGGGADRGRRQGAGAAAAGRTVQLLLGQQQAIAATAGEHVCC